ncbi:MAG: TerB family tellurite resistance protein [Bacteroidota bacterium]|nr:TerB family tellurite resistance protein [Bacteroidota bacterium]
MSLSFSASAQEDEIEQLLLNVEKLTQFKQILRDMKKGYEILSDGYNTIKNIAEGNFNLHKAFLDGLLEVSSAVRNYRRVTDIVNDQVVLIKEYRNAYDRFRQDNNFNPDEIGYIAKVYDNLLKESLRNLDELLTVITAGKARMSDDERLQAIDKIYSDMQDKLMFLRHFNNSTTILAVQRAKERNDAQTIGKIYGLDN